MKPGSIGCVLLSLAGCGSSGGLSSFANDYAASYCHFVYHCCTPSDRANPEDPLGITSTTEEMFGFATEQGCDTTLGAEAEIAFEGYQDSVSAKRMSYNQADGQACLSAIAAAAAACDPNSLWATSQTGGACDFPVFFTGLVPDGGDCTMAADCAAANSNCVAVDGGMPSEGGAPEVVTDAATCVSPAPAGGMCEGNNCAGGTCCSYVTATCVGYVAEGAPCAPGCETTPCDPTADYCDATGTGDCRPLIAVGGTCNLSNDGADCQGSNCVPNDTSDTLGTCKSEAPVIQICVGNPNGF